MADLLNHRLPATDPRMIGLRFLLTAVLAGVLSLALTALMRLELASPGLQHLCQGGIRLIADAARPCTDSGFWPVLAASHGLLMAFFTLMPALCSGLGLWLLPSLIGAKDLAFPRMALTGWWIYAASLLMAVVAMALSSAPLALAALAMTGLSAILGAINTITTFLNHRAEGVTLDRAPLFAWSLTIAAGLVLLAVPTVAGAALMLALGKGSAADLLARQGGDAEAMRQILWFFAHPQLYVIALPSIGIASHIIAIRAGRPLVGRPAVLAAMALLAGLGVTLWMQELYTNGLGVSEEGFFGIATWAFIPPALLAAMMWILTLAGGARPFDAPLLWACGFVALILGAVLLALAGTEGTIARFHYALGLGAVFGLFAGLHLWLPMITGRALPDVSGRLQALMMFAGVNLSFLPGLTEMWQNAGATLSFLSFALFVGSVGWSLRFGQRVTLPEVAGEPAPAQVRQA
ncbi:cbb3-type cytochrome c oxidase subunit I [Falsirhodobacter deserti]|uniref:cbb3-type cytochrome c oxidase subunit I n=1 Tax=Falsirhodobacter deserti TaxID=1365611 RepID=UPI000FE3CE6D|nr:cbb3-type cytochrome c oxidase subunit I [Falsirhodobacter deserti]